MIYLAGSRKEGIEVLVRGWRQLKLFMQWFEWRVIMMLCDVARECEA